jgi:hypothetical protein
MVRDRELSIATTDVFDLTRLTVDELPVLVPLLRSHAGTPGLTGPDMDGSGKRGRSTSEQHGPLPTPADCLWLILVDLQQHHAQRRHGRLVGMRPSQATYWMPDLPAPGCATPSPPSRMRPLEGGEA